MNKKLSILSLIALVAAIATTVNTMKREREGDIPIPPKRRKLEPFLTEASSEEESSKDLSSAELEEFAAFEAELLEGMNVEELQEERNVFQEVLTIDIPIIHILLRVLREANNIKEMQNAAMNLRLTNKRLNKVITDLYLPKNKNRLTSVIISLAYLIKTLTLPPRLKIEDTNRFQTRFNSVHMLIRLLYNLSESNELIDNIVLNDDTFSTVLDVFGINSTEVNQLYKQQVNYPSAHLQERLLFLAMNVNKWNTILPLGVERNEQLIYTCYAGNIAKIIRLLDEGADLNYQSTFTLTSPFFAAIEGNNIEVDEQNIFHGVVPWFLQVNPNYLNEVDSQGHSPLMVATKHGYSKLVDFFIANDADIAQTAPNGKTALMIAAENGFENIFETLIKMGLNKGNSREELINAQTNHGLTPLMFAIKNSHQNIVKIILETYAPTIETVDIKDNTPLMFASAQKNETILQLLIKFQPDINKQNNNGITALMLAAELGHNSAVQTLIDAGADIEQHDQEDVTAFIYAAVEGHNDVVQTLIAAGADIEQRDEKGLTALIQAAARGHNNVVQTLINAGADIEQHDEQYDLTALMQAAARGHNNVVQTLINAGADINVQNQNNRTALMFAAHQGHNNVVQTLIDAGADINVQDYDNKTVLILAKNHLNTVKLLLKTNQLSLKSLQSALHSPEINHFIRKIIRDHLERTAKQKAL